MGNLVKMIYSGMSKNHLSVSPQFLTNYLPILDLKIIFSLLINTRKVVCEHYNVITGLWTITLRNCSTIVNCWSCDLSAIPLTKICLQSVNHLPSVKQLPHNSMLQSDWL